MHKQYSLKNTNMYMLLIYYGSPVCANWSAISPVPLICISNWKKRKCQDMGMSEHLKDPKHTLERV